MTVLKGASFPVVGAFNETLVLDAIRRSRTGLSRVEVARETNLSAQAVSNVSRRLLDRGLIHEAGSKKTTGPGKPPTILRTEPSGAFAIGVHLDPSVITCVLLDFRGAVVREVRRRPPESGDAAATLARIADGIGEITRAAGVDPGRVAGIGVAAPGPIDADAGVIVRPPLMPGWAGFRLRDDLEQTLGMPVALTKDVTAAVFAEDWTNPSESPANFAFLYWGTGIGVGLVLDGSVHAGATQNAGDVGHAVVDPDGPVCACGRRGCFGESVRPRRLVTEALEQGVLPASPGGADLSRERVDHLFRLLGERAGGGDPAALAIVDRAARRTAWFLSNLVALLDLDRIVFGGPSWAPLRDRMLAVVSAELGGTEASIVESIALASSAVGDDVAAVGAACLVLERTFSPRSALT
jgi:predicted NBD/HSP70 family sugar kinase